jgi:hypothetical protein
VLAVIQQSPTSQSLARFSDAIAADRIAGAQLLERKNPHRADGGG